MNLLTPRIVPTVCRQFTNPYSKLAFLRARMETLRQESHNMYKGIEKQASQARKNKDYKKAGKLFSVAARLRERHAITYYNGMMDDGHQEFYNNTVRAAQNCVKKARNVEIHKSRFNTKKTKNKKNK